MRRLGNMMVVVAAAVALAACSPSEEPSDLPPGTDPSPSQTEAASAPQSSAPQGPECTAEDVQVAGEAGQQPTITLPDTCSPPKSLVSKDLEPGEGTEVEAGSTVELNYLLVAWSDKSQVETSWKTPQGQPIPVQVGAGQVIPGWDEGLVGLKEGGRRLLIIPPEKAYGPQGKPPVKPNETLVFVVDAVQVSPAGA